MKRHKQLEDLIHDIKAAHPPQAFAVYGEWGSGKTSFLSQLQLALSGESTLIDFRKGSEPAKTLLSLHKSRIPVIWFQAWRYQHEPSPIVSLLHELRASFSPGGKFWNLIKKGSDVTVQTILLSIDELTKAILGSSDLPVGSMIKNARDASQRYDANRLSTPLETTKITALLDNAIQQLLKETKEEANRIVIIIDDLDRCEPDSAWRLLEGIKVYLNLKHCVFVVGMNRQIVVDAIRKVYENMLGSKAEAEWRASDYLEKLFQNNWHLYQPNQPSHILEHFLKPLGRYETQAHPNMVKTIVEIVSTYRCLPVNPRKIKGLANLLRRYLYRAPGDQIDDAPFIFLLAYLQYFFPSIYSLLAHDRANFYDDVLLPWCSNETGAVEKINKLTNAFVGVQQTQTRERESEVSTQAKRRYYNAVLENVFLIQAFVESPEMKKIFSTPDDESKSRLNTLFETYLYV